MKVTLVRSSTTSHDIFKVAKTLSQNGYDVKLLVWDRDGNKKTDIKNGYAIHRFGFKAPVGKLTLLFYLPIWWIYECIFLLRDNSKIIHACNLDTIIPVILVKVVKRVKLCYTIYDFYADAFLPKQTPSIIRNLLTFIERYGIRFADVLFLVDESRYKQVEGAQISKLAYIYNSPPDYFDAKQRQKSKTGTETLIFFAGLISKSRGIEFMINAISDLDNIKLVIAGTGPDKKNLLENIPPDANEKIRYIGWISYEEIIKRTLEADILFVFYDPTIPNNRYASPNKLFEAMMCGKPIIVSDDSSMAEIVRKENCGVVVPYGDVESIKGAIIRLKNDADLRERLGKNGRRAYEERYSWAIMEERIIDVYRNLVDRNE